MNSPKIAFGVSGASGTVYAVHLLRALLERECRISICVSSAARKVIRCEQGLPFDPVRPDWQGWLGPIAEENLTLFAEDDLAAPPATGSEHFDGYVVCPCSMGSIGRIANATSDSLIPRMADVALKERRKLVLVPRETPFSVIHLRNMLRLAEAGAVILPACPGFYKGPRSLDDLVDFVVDRVIDQFGLEARES